MKMIIIIKFMVKIFRKHYKTNQNNKFKQKVNKIMNIKNLQYKMNIYSILLI